MNLFERIGHLWKGTECQHVTGIDYTVTKARGERIFQATCINPSPNLPSGAEGFSYSTRRDCQAIKGGTMAFCDGFLPTQKEPATK